MDSQSSFLDAGLQGCRAEWDKREAQLKLRQGWTPKTQDTETIKIIDTVLIILLRM